MTVEYIFNSSASKLSSTLCDIFTLKSPSKNTILFSLTITSKMVESK